MGLFKDFKEDFSQAVNEMMPGTEASAKDSKPEGLRGRRRCKKGIIQIRRSS